MVLAEFTLFALVLLPGVIIVVLFMLSSYNPWPKRPLEYMIKERYKYSPDGNGETFDKFFENDSVKTVHDLRPTDASVYLSVVIPAMNEEKRLPIMLDECFEYLEKRSKQSQEFTYEVIVVDDGSTDKTSQIAFEYSKKYPLFVHKLDKNVGKGGAVRCGVLCSRGSLILFADADGATRFADFEKLEAQISKGGDNKKAVAIGSRSHMEEDSIVQRTWFRTIMMVVFHSLVYIFTVRTIKDTQCGFKLFTRNAAAELFPRIHIERWAFDIELLYLAEAMKMPIKEVGVKWKEIDGSKINPFQASFEMARDIILLWFRYLFGIWKI